MTSNTAASPLQVCRDCGGGAPVDAHFCPQCTKILSIGRHGDYFSFLGLSRKLNLSSNDLEQRFRGIVTWRGRSQHPINEVFFHAVFPPWLTVPRRVAFAVEVAHPLTTVRHGSARIFPE